MACDQRSFNRRTILKASTATVGGLMSVRTASADDSDEVDCPACLELYNINEIEIVKAVPPFVAGSVTVTQSCMAIEARVQVFVDDVFVREGTVYINCIEEATVNFEYTPDQPLKPGTHELRVIVVMEDDSPTTEETVEFQVPSGRGRGPEKGKSKADRR